MLAEGIMRFLEDLGLSPDSRLVLLLAWKFKASTQCVFTKNEFINGMMELGYVWIWQSLISYYCCLFLHRCDSIEKLKAKLPALDTEIQDSNKFKDLYNFTFNYAKNPNQKGLDLDMAIAYWNIVLHDRFKILYLWCDYLQVILAANPKRIRGLIMKPC